MAILSFPPGFSVDRISTSPDMKESLDEVHMRNRDGSLGAWAMNKEIPGIYKVQCTDGGEDNGVSRQGPAMFSPEFSGASSMDYPSYRTVLCDRLCPVGGHGSAPGQKKDFLSDTPKAGHWWLLHRFLDAHTTRY